MIPSKQASAAVEFARKQIGKPYVFGAVGPDSYDCSGLMLASYQHAGVTIPRTSEEQWAAPFAKVSWGDWLPGDLVFSDFKDGQPSPGHVAMFIGGGNVVVAPHTGLNVQIQPVSDFQPFYVGSNRPAPPVTNWIVKNGDGTVLAHIHHPALWTMRHPLIFRKWGIVSFHQNP